MKTLLAAVGLCAVLPLALGAAGPELAGNWIGAIDTTRGQMEIGLNLRVEKDKLVGVIKTAHGDWSLSLIHI